MESFVSGIRGELELRTVVVWHRRPFAVEASGASEESEDGAKADEAEAQGAVRPAPMETLSVLRRERLHLDDNTTLGERLKEHSSFFDDAYLLIVPPGVDVNDSELLPVLRDLHDHIAIVRAGSAVFLRPDARFDIKVDESCYIVLPPRVILRYAQDAPEPLHLVVYILAIVVTLVVLAVVFYRTRHERADSHQIGLDTF